ncbi:PAS domain-containing sensor histidine kinase [Azohydromonas aeria]|uniref:PAS domain-containing sensor histidine kinase n=1 Tax=Azohydromonas aeria TaxID=2590212 RepID=UPI0012F8CB45|nr:HAMP domain-containing sensor histidine kinase [Azohydromonas aeria]
MDEALWWPAPHPALAVWRQPDGSLRWRCNPAAQRWGERAGVGEADWVRWALACAAALRNGDTAAGSSLGLPGTPALDATLCPQGDDAVLAWLAPVAESQARHELERLALAVQAAGLGVWESDLDGRTLYWNEAMYRLRGLDPADPRPVWQLSRLSNHPEDQSRLSALPRRHVEHGEPYDMDLRVRWPDGSEHWLTTRGRALATGPGQAVRMVGINADITDRARAQAAELQRERAEQANQAKSALLARVSHELRTPLNAVLGFAQLLQMPRGGPALAPAQREWARQIDEAGQHLLALIDDLLELARPDAEAARAEAVALAPLVEDALRWSATQARQAGVRVVAELMEGHVVRGDTRRVRQVLLNLVSNAIKYNRPGGEVRLSGCRDGEGQGARCGLCVADTGAGLTPEQVRQIGQPFNRLGAERSGIPGTGIGLAISHELLQRMGGALEVHSTPGQGSRFTFWLPAAQ